MSVESGKALKPSQGRGNQITRLRGIRHGWTTWTSSWKGLTRHPSLPRPSHICSLSTAFLLQTPPTFPPDIHPSPPPDTKPACSNVSLSTIQVGNQLRKMKVRKAQVQTGSAPGSSSPVHTSCAGLWDISSTWAWCWEKCHCCRKISW